MTIAQILPAAATVSVALLGAAWMVWYYRRLGRGDVPPSRRRIRRVSLSIMAAGLAPAVCGLSLSHGGTAFVASWSLVLAVMMVVLLTALADIVNTGRLVAQEQRREAIDAAIAAASMHKNGEP